MVDVFELISQSPKDPTLPPLGHTWEDQLTVEMTVEAVAEVVAVTVEAMTIEIEAMVVAAEVTVVAVEAAADRPLLSIVLDGSTAHVPVLTHHVAIDFVSPIGSNEYLQKKVKELLKVFP